MALNSQVKVVKAHLMSNRTITSWEAITKYRITRLSAVIYILKNEYDMRIETKHISKNGKKWAEYRFYPEDKEGQFSLI